jgi:AmiR/NasT family two-component response regulator
MIMLTSVSHWGEVRQHAGSRIDACLVKPVRQSQLQNTLAVAWSKKRQNGFDADEGLARNRRPEIETWRAISPVHRCACWWRKTTR